MRLIKQGILSLLKRLGYTLNRTDPSTKNVASSMALALARIKNVGIAPTSIIDVGSAKGRWTKVAKEYFPLARYTLVEPLHEQIQRMDDNIISENDKIVIAVAGDKKQTVPFTILEDLDGSGLYGGSGKVRQAEMIRLEDLIDTERVLIKLDTHGYEMEIFEGIGSKWENVSALVIEVYGFFVSPTGRLFHDVSLFLAGKGFRLFDIVEIVRRKSDQAFWQADAVFIRADHPLFKNNSYQ